MPLVNIDVYPVRPQVYDSYLRADIITTLDLQVAHHRPYVPNSQLGQYRTMESGMENVTVFRDAHSGGPTSNDPVFAFDATTPRMQHPFFETALFIDLCKWIDARFASGQLTLSVEHPDFDWYVQATSNPGGRYFGGVADGIQGLTYRCNHAEIARNLVPIILFKWGNTVDDDGFVTDRLYALIMECLDGARTTFSLSDVMVPPRQRVTNELRATITWNEVRAGARFGHSEDTVTTLCTQTPHPRSLGVEMELEAYVDTPSPNFSRAVCSDCEGSGEIEDYEEGIFDACSNCDGEGYMPVYVGDDNRSLRALLRNIAQNMPLRSYLPKRDGSIDDDYGVEFVSVPMLKNDLFAWLDALCNNAANNEFQGTEATGMHLHVSRGWFTNKAHLARFYGLSHGPLRHLVERYVGRTRREAMRDWAHVDEQEWRRIVHNPLGVCGDHYDAVSLDGQFTVEVRFFAGTTDALEAKANVELILAMVAYSQPANGVCKYPYTDSTWATDARYHHPTLWNTVEKEFLAWLWEHRKDYKFLIEHLNKHPEIGDMTRNLADDDKKRRDAVRAAKKAKKEALRKKEGERAVCV